MVEPLISVIVPINNVEHWLTRCIDSIINQTYRNLQILLINDGSTDRSDRICLSYQDPRIEYIVIEHKGASTARNEGLRRAKGEYIGFVDADDWCEPGMYEVLLHAILRDHSDAVRCNHFNVRNSSKACSIKRPCKQIVTGREAVIDTLYRTETSGFGGIVWNTLFRADIVQDNTILFDPDLFYGEDTDWILQFFIRSSRISLIPECLYNYNQDNTSNITHGYQNHYPLKILQKKRIFLIEYRFDSRHIALVENSLRMTEIMMEIEAYCQGNKEQAETIRSCSIVRDVLKKNEWNLGLYKVALVMFMIRMHIPAKTVGLIMRLHR